MNYDLNEEQNILKEAAHKFLVKECPSEFVRRMDEDETGFSEELWKKMADLGWMSLLIPEEYDGFGGSFLDLAVLLSEMGYVCLPGPFFTSVVLGGLTLLEGGSQAQKEAMLPLLASGERILTVAWVEKEGLYTPGGIAAVAESDGENFLISGTKLFVPDAHLAQDMICVARTEKNPGDPENGISLFLVDSHSPGLRVALLETMAGDKQCEVVFDRVSVPGTNLLGELNQGWPILKRVLFLCAVAKCAEMVGGARRVMELVVPYTKERTQFGRPIGAFQAVQHHCADMLTYADTMQFMTFQAAWRISAGIPFEKEAAMCKAWVSDSYRKLVALGHQVLGGVSFMEEHDLQLYFKRAKAGELMFGDAEIHTEWVARQMGL